VAIASMPDANEELRAKPSGAAKPSSRSSRKGGSNENASDQGSYSADLLRDSEYELAQPSTEEWANRDPEEIDHRYAQVELDYFRIVDDYLVQANAATDLYRDCIRDFQKWRFWTILATGGLAVVSGCAAFGFSNQKISPSSSITWSQIISAAAAIYAGFLTLAGNLENFFNFGEKAAGYREARDILLDRYREYTFKWFYYIEAFGRTPGGCCNAGRLYRQLIDSDQGLRHKLKQLTEVRGRGAPSGSANAVGG
jgi:hypothetical protein